jgi:FMN phosphatase YigB (HAD superfamily)
MFQAVLKNVNSKKEECLFIDDRIINIQNALSFGFAALLFPHEASFGAAYLSKIFEEIGLSKF